MSSDSHIAEVSPEPSGADAWADRKLAILSELAEAGLEIALALKARIVETAAAEPEAGSAEACACLAHAFDRASRAVRLSIALRDRVQKDAAAPKPAADHETRTQRADRVRRIVGRSAWNRGVDRDMRETLDQMARERLYDRDITGDLLDQPIGAIVARICADLRMPPGWLELAEEAWAQAEITERPPGSPYAAWPDLPPEPEYVDDDEDDLEDDTEPASSGTG